MRTDDTTMEQQEKDVVAVLKDIQDTMASLWLPTTTQDVAAIYGADVDKVTRILERLVRQGIVEKEQRVVDGRIKNTWTLVEGAR